MRQRPKHRLGVIIILGVIVASLAYWLDSPNSGPTNSPLERFDINTRPTNQQLLFDYGNLLSDFQESTDEFLKRVAKRYTIEAAIVTLATLPENHTIKTLATDLMNGWHIGRNFDGRGFVLLMVDDIKEVRLEVSYELEDVFTDAFVGYIEDRQLKPYFMSEQIGTGLVAVIEELDQRAQLKHALKYSQESIKKIDEELLAGGAGAGRQLSKYQQETVSSVGKKYPAGDTVKQAWKNLLNAWRDGVNDPNLAVYTEMTKLAYRDYVNSPKSRILKNYQLWGNRAFSVNRNNHHAVISFGSEMDWNNSPFLFAHTPSGWKLDLVSTRKWVRMGNSPNWGIEQSDHPYVELLSYAPQWVGQDIPWDATDRYTIEKDAAIAKQILDLEKRYKSNPNDFDTALELGRLNTIGSMRPKHIFPRLKKAKSLQPKDPRPHKYLAIAHVSTTYQYKSAIKEMLVYVKLLPKSEFGWKFLGYLYYQEKNFAQSVKAFNKAIDLNNDNTYALTWLAKSYTRLLQKTARIDPRRIHYRKKAIDSFKKAAQAASANPLRIQWTKQWLEGAKIL